MCVGQTPHGALTPVGERAGLLTAAVQRNEGVRAEAQDACPMRGRPPDRGQSQAISFIGAVVIVSYSLSFVKLLPGVYLCDPVLWYTKLDTLGFYIFIESALQIHCKDVSVKMAVKILIFLSQRQS